MMSLDAHERPPDRIRNVYKRYQKLRGAALDNDSDLLDLSVSNMAGQLHVVRSISPTDLASAFQGFMADGSESLVLPDASVPVYEHRHMPGRSNLVCVIAAIS